MAARSQQLLFQFGYWGADFWGLAPQPGRCTVISALAERLRDAGAHPWAWSFAARTDRGVHARRTWVSCRVAADWDAVAGARRLQVPGDVRLRDLQLAVLSARTMVRATVAARWYRYLLRLPSASAPTAPTCLCSAQAWCLERACDVDLLRAAAARAQAQPQDVCAWLPAARRQARPGPHLRPLLAVRVTPERAPCCGGARLQLDVVGAGFVRYMVRRLVAEWVQRGTPTADVGGRAPAAGLCLWDLRPSAALAALLPAAWGTANAADWPLGG